MYVICVYKSIRFVYVKVELIIRDVLQPILLACLLDFDVEVAIHNMLQALS